jgi:hypothetical protein
MKPDEILARIMPKWEEFCKTKEWKKFIVTDGPSYETCNLENYEDCLQCVGNHENCPYPLIDGKNIAVTPDDGGFLINALREIFPETGMTEDEFFERYEYCEDNGMFDFEESEYYEICYQNGTMMANIVFPSIKEAREYMDTAIREVISAVFDPDLKMDEEENSET